MTALELAQAILLDHAAGEHAAHDDPTVGCRFPGCEEAFWTFARAQEREEAQVLVLGARVQILGGLEDGQVGTIVDVGLPDAPRFRVRVEPCPYCGAGPCRGTALSANGADLERFDRIHAGRGIARNPGTIGGLPTHRLSLLEGP